MEHTVSDLPDLRIEPKAQVYPFAYNEEELPDLLPFIVRRYPDPDNAAGALGTPLFASRPAERDRGVADDPQHGRPGELCLYPPLGRRNPRPRADPRARSRKLPGSGAADDGSGASLSASLPVSCPAMCMFPAGTSRKSWRRFYACLVPGVSAGGRLGGFRSDKRHRRQSRPDPGRRRPRSAAGRAALGHLVWPDRGQSGNVGRGTVRRTDGSGN